MTRPNPELNKLHRENPQPGDWWQEHMCFYHVVLKVFEDGSVVIAKRDRKVTDGQRPDLAEAHVVTKVQHMQSTQGADVVTDNEMGRYWLSEWVDCYGSKYKELPVPIIPPFIYNDDVHIVGSAEFELAKLGRDRRAAYQKVHETLDAYLSNTTIETYNELAVVLHHALGQFLAQCKPVNFAGLQLEVDSNQDLDLVVFSTFQFGKEPRAFFTMIREKGVVPSAVPADVHGSLETYLKDFANDISRMAYLPLSAVRVMSELGIELVGITGTDGTDITEFQLTYQWAGSTILLQVNLKPLMEDCEAMKEILAGLHDV
jgi:hypothetical protein